MILLYVLRAFFVLALLAVGWTLVESGQLLPDATLFAFLGVAVLGIAVIVFDSFLPRKSLTAISGVFFGLVVGLCLSYAVSLVITYLSNVFAPNSGPSFERTVGTLKLLVGLVLCYFCVSFVLQTKDDVRFVIPYVEFTKQVKGQHPLILDTSVIIDGRIADIAETGVLDQKLVVPRFVLQELQNVADSNDRLKRNRGRRGLDILNRLQASKRIEIEILDTSLTATDADEPVDQRIINLAKTLNGRVVTNDFNLNKVARVQGVPVININDLANALRAVVLPGEPLQVKIIRPGEESTQGVGYLDDGTMVVVEGARQLVGGVADLTVTSVLQTSAGRMIFGRADGAATAERRRGGRSDSGQI